MDNEIKKMKKQETIFSVILGILILLVIFVVLFVVSNKDKDNTLVDEVNYFNDYNNYVILEDIDTSKYMDLYSSVNLKKVKFKNVSSLLYDSFLNKEEEYIKSIEDNIDSNKKFIEEYIKENNIRNYKLNSNIDSTILLDMKDGVLSILYLIEEEIDYKGVNNYINNIVIDVKNNKVLSNGDILSSYNVSTEQVINEVYNNYTMDKELDKDVFVSKISDKFDDYIYLYVYMDSLYLKYNKSDISKLVNEEDVASVRYSTVKLSGN